MRRTNPCTRIHFLNIPCYFPLTAYIHILLQPTPSEKRKRTSVGSVQRTPLSVLKNSFTPTTPYTPYNPHARVTRATAKKQTELRKQQIIQEEQEYEHDRESSDNKLSDMDVRSSIASYTSATTDVSQAEEVVRESTASYTSVAEESSQAEDDTDSHKTRRRLRKRKSVEQSSSCNEDTEEESNKENVMGPPAAPPAKKAKSTTTRMRVTRAAAKKAQDSSESEDAATEHVSLTAHIIYQFHTSIHFLILKDRGTHKEEEGTSTEAIT